jgi:hypothetical protein
MIPGDNLDHGGQPWRRAGDGGDGRALTKDLVQRIVTIAESDLTETAGAGYPDVKSDDPKAADEALGQFISDTVACLDVQR